MRCLDELSTTKFSPPLNLKDAEQVHKDFENLKKKKGRRGNKNSAEEIDSYYINVVEELNDFNDWCISDNNAWGIPIPHFIYKGTGKLLMDQEIVEHFAAQIEQFGTSDIWYTFDKVDLLPPRYKQEAA